MSEFNVAESVGETCHWIRQQAAEADTNGAAIFTALLEILGPTPPAGVPIDRSTMRREHPFELRRGTSTVMLSTLKGDDPLVAAAITPLVWESDIGDRVPLAYLEWPTLPESRSALLFHPEHGPELWPVLLELMS